VRQHQGVDAGRPFEQMQEAGMRTEHLDQIVRQKDPELLKAVEHLSKGDNQITVRRDHGQSVTYRPSRLKGVNVYREMACEIAAGERLQFTARDKKLEVANRDLEL
jgi:hypothetical protein